MILDRLTDKEAAQVIVEILALTALAPFVIGIMAVNKELRPTDRKSVV